MGFGMGIGMFNIMFVLVFGIVIVMIAGSFLKDLKENLENPFLLGF